jgi:hypothetical protein
VGKQSGFSAVKPLPTLLLCWPCPPKVLLPVPAAVSLLQRLRLPNGQMALPGSWAAEGLERWAAGGRCLTSLAIA